MNKQIYKPKIKKFLGKDKLNRLLKRLQVDVTKCTIDFGKKKGQVHSDDMQNRYRNFGICSKGKKHSKEIQDLDCIDIECAVRSFTITSKTIKSKSRESNYKSRPYKMYGRLWKIPTKEI